MIPFTNAQCAESDESTCHLDRVDVLVFDTQGRRHNLRGKEGQSLVDLLAENEESLGAGTPSTTFEKSGPWIVVLVALHSFTADLKLVQVRSWWLCRCCWAKSGRTRSPGGSSVNPQ